MENNPSKLGLNSNQTTLNNQAFDAASSPLTPSAEGSSRVQQVSAAQNPFPDGVQDLLSLNPKKRLQTIFVSTQPDDYFCGLAQNRQLDEKSRLAAAIKIKDNETRDAALAELANDQSLEDELRIRAADKLIDSGKKHAVFTQLAEDDSLSELCRLEAKVSTESYRVNTPNLMDTIEMVSAAPAQDKALDAPSNDSTEASLASVAIKGDVLRAAKNPEPQRLDSAENTKVATPSRVRVASIFLQGDSQTTKAQGESPKPRLNTSSSVRGAKSFSPGRIKEDVLQEAKDPEPQRLPSVQNNKAPASSPGRIVSVFLQGDRQNTKLDEPLRIRIAENLPQGESRENALLALAQDTTMDARYRLQAAQKLTPGQIREDLLLALAQDKNLDKKDRLGALASLAPGQIKEELLLVLLNKYRQRDKKG